MEFEAFDSLDDMLNALDRSRRNADAMVKPFQAAIRPGDHYSPHGFTIYGKILPDPEPRPPALQHYRFARAYSVACPDGELGDVHVSTIDRILNCAEFLLAKQRLWADEA